MNLIEFFLDFSEFYQYISSLTKFFFLLLKINEFVHKRTVTRRLLANNVTSNKSFQWLCEMRFYFDPRQSEVLQQLTIHMANARFFYGFEYLGVQDRLVQTPLTDRCYLTMTQALESRLGGSPFGPAGTGKTESVKALGHQLGRFVLVFNCDETFDFQAMGRIFVGLCQVGAWGCFDGMYSVFVIRYQKYPFPVEVTYAN